MKITRLIGLICFSIALLSLLFQEWIAEHHLRTLSHLINGVLIGMLFMAAYFESPRRKSQLD
jgi:uncharacterized membrane protein YadS